jgi:hypothetical protein
MTMRTRLFCTVLEARDNPSDPGLVDIYGSTPPTDPTPPGDPGTMGSGAGALADVGAGDQVIDPVVLDTLYGSGSGSTP